MNEFEKIIRIQVTEDSLYMLTDEGNVYRKWYDKKEAGWKFKKIFRGPNSYD